MNPDTLVPLLSKKPKTVKLHELKQPSLFDQLRADIDKSSFYLLEPHYQNDEILVCRKAQLHIDDSELDQALAILTSFDSLLAEGLMAQALSKSKAWSVVQSYVHPYIHWSKERCLSSSLIEQEGLVSIFEAAYSAAYADKNFDYAQFLLERAYFLAQEVKLNVTANRLDTLKTQLVNLSDISSV